MTGTGDEMATVTLGDLPALVGRTAAQVARLAALHAEIPGPPHGVILDTLRQLAAALDRARPAADALALLYDAASSALREENERLRAENEELRARLTGRRHLAAV